MFSISFGFYINSKDKNIIQNLAIRVIFMDHIEVGSDQLTMHIELKFTKLDV